MFEVIVGPAHEPVMSDTVPVTVFHLQLGKVVVLRHVVFLVVVTIFHIFLTLKNISQLTKPLQLIISF